ncbi:MAG: sulfatase [Mariniblastus sp.]|nr:sulfatase [Mariniblastus sp.]
MKVFLNTPITVSLLLVLALSGSFAPARAEDQPNILLIYLDDFGWRDTGYMGSDFYETPHLDRLAEGGMIFTDAYSCAANCAPARASLLSGQYTPRHRIFNVGTNPRGNAKHRRLEHITGTSTLSPDLRTWADQLQAAGYRTATMGKWHLSSDPLPYGFDVNIGGTRSGGPPKGYYPPHGNAPGLQDAPSGEYVTDRLSSEAIKFIEASQNQPWCLYLTHFAVHTPIQPKRELLAKYEGKTPGALHNNAKMATMIQAVDDGVGRIMEKLDELELTDQTVVLFYSDNGGYGPATDMAPLKGYKGTYYEGGIRVPFFVNWPGVVKPGQTNSEPITGVDLYPTLCEIGHAKLPADQPLDGISLVPLFEGKRLPAESRSLFWHFPNYLQSYAQVHDEQRDPLFRTRPCSVIRHGKWKLHQYFEDNAVELYDLENDMGETTNLATEMPDKTGELLARLKQWQIDINAPVPSQANPEFDAEAEQKAIKQKTAPAQNGNGRRRNGSGR